MHHEKQLIFGMGAGECGLGLLNEILSRQHNCQSTLDQPPLLPWKSSTSNRLIQERINRLAKKSNANFVADMAAFYLPYVQAAIEHCANVRFICLKRPKLESISAMCHQLDQSSPRAINHWASDVSGPWSHDFLTSRSFPKFDINNRFEGVCQYWEQYYQAVDQLCTQYPDNIQVWDTEDLTSEAGVSEVLSFAGIPVEDQVIITGQRPVSEPLTQQQINQPRTHRYPNKNDPRRCVILVPYQGLIHQECEEALKELERRGYPVRRVSGYAAIDQGRNQLATDALVDGYEEVIWVDSDVAFHPDSIDQLRSHPQEIVCGIYPQKNKRALASHVMPGSKSLTFGKEGGLIEILYAGTGFLMIRRTAFLKIFEQLKLPVCNERFGRATIPFYMPMTRTIEEGAWYLAEDYAFSERARQCGIKVYADTSIRLWHIGNYKFGWEDAGMDRPRFGTFTMNFSGQGDQKTSTEGTKLLSDFAADYPWPTQRPETRITEFPERPSMDLADILGKHLDQNTSLLFEIGAGSGQLTRLLAKHPSRAKIIALDQWKKEDQANTNEIQDQFYAECWNQRQQIIPMPGELRQGIQTVADAKLEPDVVLVHTDSNDEAAAEILAGVFDCFPQAKVIGNNMTSDADWELIERITTSKDIHLQRHNQAWIANGE